MRCITRFAIPALLGLALSLTGAGVRPAAAQAEGGTVLRGDVNGDGSISALDGLAVLSHVVGKNLPQGFRVLPFGDADGNGEVTALDALVILAYIVGKDVSQFPIGKPVVVTGAVTISPDHLKLRVDETVRLTAKVAGNDTAAVIWRSAKPGVASITASGDVTGHVPGTVDIVAMAAADTTKRASISIEVKGESVSVTPDSATLVIGQTRQFTAVVNNPAGNPIPSRKVIWAVSDTSVIRVSSTGLVTAVGIGFASVTAIDEKDSKVTGGAVINVVAKAATPRQYLVSTDTPDPAPGATITIRAQLADSLGAAVKTAGRTVTWSKTLPAGSFATPTSTTDTAGVATVAYTVSTTAGAVDSVTATDNAGLKGTSGPIRVQIGAAASIRIIAGNSQSVKVNTAVPIPPKVQVVDASGNGVPNVAVTFTPTPGSGSVTGGTQTTSASGEATVGSWTLGTTPGLDSLTVSAAGITVTITATALPGEPTDIALLDGDNQTGEVGKTLAQPLRVLVTDSLGNGVPGDTVRWEVDPGNGSLSDSISLTNGSGIASITWTLGTVADTQTVRARRDTLNGSPVTFTAAATPAGASRLSITTQPSDSVQSGAAFPRQPVVQLRDEFGNAVSQSGVEITATIASGGGALGDTTTVTTNASGVATFTNLSITGTVGDRTLSFSSSGLTGATSSTISVSAGAPAKLEITTQPSATAQSGTPFAQQPAVQLQDASGNPVAQAGVQVAAEIASGGGTLGGTTTVSTNTSGVAPFTDLVITGAAGDHTLSFSSAGLEADTSSTVTLTAGPPANITVQAGDNQTAVAGSAVAVAPAVKVTDVDGNPVAGVSVTFAPSGNGSVTGSPATTDASGVATLGSWTLATTAGANTLTATAGALSTTFNATGTAGAPANITKTAGDGQTATAGTAVATAPAVTVTDTNGNPVAGVSVTFAPSGNGSVTGSPATTDASGVATLGSWTLATTAGANTLTATAGALSTTFSATGTAGAPANITKTAGDGQTATVGTAVATAPSVTITDTNGNPVAGVEVTFAPSGNGSVTGSPATTDASGVATLGSWTLATTAGANTLTATAGALSTTFNATGTAGAPANITKTAGDGQTATVGTAVATAPSVTITDTNGNPVAGVSVTFAPSGNGSVTGSPATTDASGVATLGSWTLATTAGANTLTATAGALSTTFSATGTAGAPANITKTAGDGQTATGGTAVATAPSVTITDTNGNPVAGVSVTFAPSGNGSVTGSPATTDASGVATLGSWTLATGAGANTLTATAGALSTTFSATSTVGPPANITKTAGDGQTATVGTAVATAPSVTITDANGNPVAGVSVTFAPSGNGSVTGSPATTDASGVATLGSWTLATTAGANTLTATAGALSTTFNATGTAGAPANITKTAGDGQTATVGTAVATAPSVTITDTNGNPVAGVSVTFAPSGNGSVTGSPATTDASGVATLGSWTLATTVGANTLTATAGALSTTFSATGTAGPPANIVKTAGDGQTATVGTAVATAPSVTITDASGNPVAGVSVTFAPSGNGSVTGSPATTDASGVATLGSWTLATAAGANTLTATAGALSTTFNATGTAGPPANIVKTAGDGQSATVGTAVATPPSVTITDTYGNPVSAGTAVTFSVASGGGSVTGGSATTNASGVATVGSWTLGTTSGSNTLTASAGALTTTFSATGTAGPPANITKTAGDEQNGTVGSPVATAPTVHVTDQYGNVVPGATINFTVTGGGGSTTGASPTTNASGDAAVGSWTLGSGPTTNTLQAAATTGTAAPVTFTAYVPPTATTDLSQAMGNTTLPDSITPNVLANDFSIDGGTLSVTSTGALTTVRGGTLTLAANGVFSYLPAAGVTGRDSVNYTITDGRLSGTGWIKLALIGKVWYVDNASASATHDGRDVSPFTTVALAEASAGANDTILVRTGSGVTAGGTLKNGQILRGQGHSAPFTVTINTRSLTLLPTGSAPTLGALTLGSGNTLRGFNSGNVGPTGTALTGSSFGTLTVSEMGINTDGRALSLTTGTLNGSFTQLRSTGGTNNVFLSGVATTGTSTLGGAGDVLQGATGDAFVVASGTGSFTYSGNVTQASNAATVNVSGGHSGTLTFQTGTVSATNGTGLQFNNADGSYAFSGTNTLNGGNAGVDVSNGSSGTFTFSGSSSITDPTAETVAISNSTPTFTYSGTLSKTGSGSGITLSSNTGGTITFDGPSKVFSTGTATAVNITGNGATVVFSDSLKITTTTGAGFNAAGGGTVRVAGANNSITSAGGTALSVVSTTIGTGGLNFRSISTNGGTDGVVLSSTGNTAGLTVTGSGTAGSGGTIRNHTQRGLRASNAVNVSLTHMSFLNNGTANLSAAATCGDALNGLNTNCAAAIDLQSVTGVTIANDSIDGGAQIGINGNGVQNLTITNTAVRNFGNEVNEDGVQMANLTGTNTVTNSRFVSTFHRGLEVQNSTGTSNLTVTGSTFDRGTYLSTSSDGVAVMMRGTATMNATVRSSTFRRWFSAAVFGQVFDDATMNLMVGDTTAGGAANGNTSTENSLLTQVVSDGTADMRFGVGHNTHTVSGVVTSGSTPVTFRKGTGSTGTYRGTFAFNTIGNGTAGSGNNCAGCNAVSMTNEGASGGYNVRIISNLIQNVNQRGVEAIHQFNDVMSVIVRDNTIRFPEATIGQAIWGQSSNDASDTGTLCMDIRNNTIGGLWDTAIDPAGRNIRVRQAPPGGTAPFQVVGLTGSTATDMQNYLNTNNGITNASATATTSFTSVASCP